MIYIIYKTIKIKIIKFKIKNMKINSKICKKEKMRI